MEAVYLERNRISFFWIVLNLHSYTRLQNINYYTSNNINQKGNNVKSNKHKHLYKQAWA